MRAFTPHYLSTGFAVSGQILPEFYQEIKQAGFKTIIINRPDGEQNEQPSSALLREACTAHGIKSVYLPTTMSLSPHIIADMHDALCQMPSPVLAYCASGTRSALLWCFACLHSPPFLTDNLTAPKDINEHISFILARTAQAGYNLNHIEAQLQHYASTQL